MSKKYDMTIGGEAVSADSYVEIRNPANTEEVVGQAPVGTKEHLDKAIAAAEKAYQSWRHSSEEERVNACNAIAGVCTEHAEELSVRARRLRRVGGIYRIHEFAGQGHRRQRRATCTAETRSSRRRRIHYSLELATDHCDLAHRSGNTHRQYGRNKAIAFYATQHVAHG